MKILSERSKESKKQKKNKGSVLVAESAYNAQNAQFGLEMSKEKLWNILMANFIGQWSSWGKLSNASSLDVIVDFLNVMRPNWRYGIIWNIWKMPGLMSLTCFFVKLGAKLYLFFFWQGSRYEIVWKVSKFQHMISLRNVGWSIQILNLNSKWLV